MQCQLFRKKKNEKAGKGSTECHSNALAEDQGVFQHFARHCTAPIVQLTQIKIQSNKYVYNKVTEHRYKFYFFSENIP